MANRSLHDRLLDVRDSILANPNFQRFAGAFPLTRPVARKRAGALFDLCAGFVYSQILLACVRLRLFERLSNGALSAAEAASLFALPLERATLLLDAAKALRLVQGRSGGRYGLGPLGAALLGNPGVTAMIEHHAMLYGDLSDPVAMLRDRTSGALARYWPYATAEQPGNLTREQITPYTALMSSSQPMIAQEVIRAYSFKQHQCLLDVGGGDGAFVTAVAEHAPELKVKLFDLPAVADKANERFAANGLSSRAIATGGSFLHDSLPRGADIISLVRIVHDHDDDSVRKLLSAAYDALGSGGTLLIAEPLSGVRGSEQVGDAYFAFYLLAMGSGRPRSFAQVRDLVEAAGFLNVTLHRTSMPMLTSVVTAQVNSKKR
jgi:demethylspheroidene O-methyltransferase